jgi:hypothetical protein
VMSNVFDSAASSHNDVDSHVIITVTRLYISEILGFRTLSIVLVLKNKLMKNRTFRKLDMFPSSGDGKNPILLGPLERDVYKGPNRIGGFPHMRTESRSSFRNFVFP